MGDLKEHKRVVKIWRWKYISQNKRSKINGLRFKCSVEIVSTLIANGLIRKVTWGPLKCSPSLFPKMIYLWFGSECAPVFNLNALYSPCMCLLHINCYICLFVCLGWVDGNIVVLTCMSSVFFSSCRAVMLRGIHTCKMKLWCHISK